MQKFDSINVIPFIDIMLVLLAIVLTTATFTVSGKLDISLPASEGNAQTDVLQPLEIAIDAHLKTYINGIESDETELQLRLRDSDQHAPVVLVVDESVPFAKFVWVVELLKERSMDKVSIRTRKTP